MTSPPRRGSMQVLPTSSQDTAFASSIRAWRLRHCAGGRAGGANMSTNGDMVECNPLRVGRFNPAQAYALKSCAVLAAAIGLLWSCANAQAGDPVSAQDILNALTPKLTRSLRGPTADEAQQQTPEQQKFVNSVRNRSTRSLTLDERNELATMSKDRPSIDIEIDFAYNSA